MFESGVTRGYEAREQAGRQMPGAVQLACMVLLVGAGYYVGALLGKSLRFPDSHLSLIWPPTAILLAALLLAPTRIWLIYLLALSRVHIFAQFQDGVPAWGILSQLAGNFGQALLAAASVRYFNKETLPLCPQRVGTRLRVCLAGAHPVERPFDPNHRAAYHFII